MRLPSFLSSATFRFTAAYAALFSFSVLIVSVLVYYGATAFWQGKLQQTVNDEISALHAIYEDEGISGLQSLIEGRSEGSDEESVAYLLQDLRGNRLAGRLPAGPAIEGWRDVVPPWGEEEEPFLAKGLVLSRQWYLVVGHNADELYETRELVLDGLAWSIGVSLPLALFGGFLMSALILKRIEGINRATLDIRQGNLDRRIPLSGSNDEFDRVAAHINAMLDGICDLTEGLRQVSNDIAHDLRTPLTRMRQELAAARRKPLTEAEVSQLLDSTTSEIDSLLSAFSALMRIAQIDSGMRKSAFKNFDLSHTCEQIVEDFEPIIGENGKKLKAEIEPSIRYFGDEPLIIQMLVNLIENAISHSGENGEITLTLAHASASVEASIRDNGPGIPEQEREKVFRRFYRLDKSRHGGGVGLGLSTVAAIAKLHHIRLALSDNGPGLKVGLSFPVEAAP